MAKKPQIVEPKNTAKPQSDAVDQPKITREELEEKYKNGCEKYFSELDKVVESNKARIAIAMVLDENTDLPPLLYRRGNTYELAKMVSQLLKVLKKQLVEEL